MPVQVSYPGVYIQELPSGARTLSGVSTSVALFVGQTLRGPLGVPRRVLGFTEFQRVYGSETRLGELSDQVRQFFLNGGGEAFVVRIANGATQARVDLRASASGPVVLRLRAKDYGVDGNMLRAEVDYATASPESTFNLRVSRLRLGVGGRIEVESSERFDNLSMNPSDGRYAGTYVSQRSSLVETEVPAGLDAALVPFKGYALSGWLFDGAAALPALSSAVATAFRTATQNSLQISVDDSPFVTVTLPATFGDWASAINTALNPYGVSLTIQWVNAVGGAGFRYLLFQSATAGSGGRVRIAPAPNNDIALALRLGSAQGGLEVDGRAQQRPAPMGITSSLGDLDPSDTDFLRALTTLADAAKSDLATWTLTEGASLTHTQTIAFPGAASDALSVGLAAPAAPRLGSLLDLRANLALLSESIRSNTGGRWSAALVENGLRLQLLPNYGEDNGDIGARFTSGPTLNLGAAGQALSGDSNVSRYALGLGAAALGAYQVSGAAALNGGTPTRADYEAVLPTIDREIDLFNLLILPRADAQTDLQRAELWGMMSSFCQQKRAFLLIDPPADWSDRDLARSGIANVRIGLTKDHAAIYWPRLLLRENGVERAIDPSGSVAGIMARTDANRGVWKAPAGLEADVRGVSGVEVPLSDPDNGVVNPQAINAIRAFVNGIIVWGARTLDGYDNTNNEDYRYVPVRRLALFIEESLYRGLKFAVFEPNDEPLWAQIRLAAGAFMNNLFRRGAFQGQKASEAYFVKCDAETTTQNDINLGIVNVVVGFAALKPAEFVVVTVRQIAGQVQV